jgi:hypothetical protein
MVKKKVCPIEDSVTEGDGATENSIYWQCLSS